MWSQSCFSLQHFHYCTLNCASPLAFFHAIVPLLTSSCHFTCPFHTIIPYITLFLVLSTLPILFHLPFSSDPSSHLTLFFSLPWPSFILFSNCTLSPLFSDSNYMATAITTFLPSPFSLSSFLCPLPFILPTSPPHTQLTLAFLSSILSAQPSSFPHILLSPHLPPAASLAVSYSDSDIITLVVTGFICTLWTYTSAWLIVQGLGPTEPHPDWDRVTDRTILKPLQPAYHWIFFHYLFWYVKFNTSS